jgi:predicted DNA-binding antitoxin AbrB/MazE fold protein
MYKTIQGIYQDGVIIPAEPIEMNDNSQILITVYSETDEIPLSPFNKGGIEEGLQKLSTAELLKLAEARTEKLKSLGVSRDVALKQLGELIEEIRQDAISRGVAVEDDEIAEWWRYR